MIFVRFMIGFTLFLISIALFNALNMDFEGLLAPQLWKIGIASGVIGALAYILEGKN